MIEGPTISERVRRRLTALLGDDRPDGERLLAALQEMRDLEGIPAFGESLRLLATVELPEPRAESVLRALLRHRDSIARDLGRDPGLRVAAVDYLSNVTKLVPNPAIVDRGQLERTTRSAITDSLTGLYNRRHFVERLELEIRRCRRYRQRLSLLVFDVDGFKSLNDLHGHPFGDLVLQRISRVIRRAVREADVACRPGGDEFAMILPETARAGATALAERIRLAVQDTFRDKPVAGKPVRVGVTGGISAYPEDAEDSGGLLRCADQAMYRAKREGRNRVASHHDDRRRAERYPGRDDRTVELLFDDGAQSIAATPVDLSLLGGLFELDEGCPGTVPVQATFAAGASSSVDGDWVRVGRIVRIEDSGRRKGSVRAAVSFERPLDADCLARFVQFAPRRRAMAEPGGHA